LDWGKGLIPAVIQDVDTRAVLMLGYMNEEAWDATQKTKRVTFFSRSKDRLWTKGETSGNFLNFVSFAIDCDNDTILIQAHPEGPVCHTGGKTCFGDEDSDSILFLKTLSALIHDRNKQRPAGSYTTKLFEEGGSRIAQKVGEEGVELALARVKNDKDEILDESADLLFHLMVLLEDSGLNLADACEVLRKRHK